MCERRWWGALIHLVQNRPPCPHVAVPFGVPAGSPHRPAGRVRAPCQSCSDHTSPNIAASATPAAGPTDFPNPIRKIGSGIARIIMHAAASMGRRILAAAGGGYPLPVPKPLAQTGSRGGHGQGDRPQAQHGTGQVEEVCTLIARLSVRWGRSLAIQRPPRAAGRGPSTVHAPSRLGRAK